MHIQPNGEPKIKHMVVMLMENRALDHFFGCMAGEGVIGLEGINGSHTLPKDPNNASAGEVTVTCGTANYGTALCASSAPHSPSTCLLARVCGPLLPQCASTVLRTPHTSTSFLT